MAKATATTNVSLAIDASEAARDNTKQQRALEIFNAHLMSENRRQECLAAFKKELDMKDSTAATYYYLCQQKFDAARADQDKAVVESKAKRKYSAVKTDKAGKVTKVHYFLKKKDAAEYNEAFNFDGVQDGIVEKGAKVG